MKPFYTLVVSDIKGQPPRHLPSTVSTKFRSFKRAWTCLKRYHKQNRDVVLVERDENGIRETWQVLAEHAINI